MPDKVTAPAIRYAEDLSICETIDLGTYTLTAEAITDFGRAWDPLPMHVDEMAARDSYFGGLIGSGVQLFAIFQRLAVLGAYRHWAVIAGKSLKDMRLTAPVRPGDTLRGVLTITAVRPGRQIGRSTVTIEGALFKGKQRIMELTTECVVRNRDKP